MHSAESPAAVDFVLEVEDRPVVAVAVGRRDHDGSGPVPEQDTGRPVLVVDDARHHVGADDQRVLVRAGRDQLAGGGEGVGERRAGGAQVESPRAPRADLVLDETGGAREEHVGRDGPDDDDADVVRRELGVGERAHGGFLAEVRGGDARIDDMPLADPGALEDPLVRGVDHLLQVGVGQHARRHVGGERRNRRRAAAAPRQPAPCGGITTGVHPFPARRARKRHRRGRWRRGRAACGRRIRSESGTARRCPRWRPSLR